MIMNSDSILLTAFAFTIFTIGGLAFLKTQKILKKWVTSRRFRRGVIGETIAKKWLEQQGFKILSEQEEFEGEILINGQVQAIKMKPDYVVKKGGKLGVVEVKTGKKAIDPRNSNSRRQILEYWHHLDIDEIYLFDAENKDLISLDFGNRKRSHTASTIVKCCFSFVLGSVVSALLVWQTLSK